MTMTIKVRKQKKNMSPQSCVKRSLGTGIIETRPLKSNSTFPYTDSVHDDHDNHNGHESSFVVRLRHNPSTTTTKVNTKILTALSTISVSSGSSSNSRNSNSSSSVFDTTTDLSYHNRSEQEKSESILNSLTQDEQSSIPDKFMTLRHYRAEKVCKFPMQNERNYFDLELSVFLLKNSISPLGRYFESCGGD